MADTKEELVAEAKSEGLALPPKATKVEVEQVVEQRRESTAALGPVIPTGETKPVPPASSGAPVKAQQFDTYDEIPDALR